MQGKYTVTVCTRRQTEQEHTVGMSITETVYLSMYLSLVAKRKTETKKKNYKVEKKKSCICHMK